MGPPVPHLPEERVVHADEGVLPAAVDLGDPGAVEEQAREGDGDAPALVHRQLQREVEGRVDVLRDVAVGDIGGEHGAGEDDGDGDVVQEVGQRGGGPRHGVRAVEHHDGVRARGAVPNAVGHDEPVGGVHVGAVLGHQIDDGDVMLEAHQAGTDAEQLLPREAGLEAPVGLHGRDGPAGGQ